jgi:hypothetical protein
MKKATWILCGLLMFAGCYFDEHVPIEMTSMSQAQPLENEKSLDSTIRFDIGSLEITGGEQTKDLYSFDLEYDKASYKPEVQYQADPAGEEGKLYFNLQSTFRSGVRRHRYNNRIRMAFSNSVPLSLTVNAGVGDARLSLSGMKLSRVNLEAGVGGAKIAVYEPNPIPCSYVGIKNGVGGLDAVGLGNLDFRTLEFEGGVGGANLDLTGEWKKDAEIHIKVGVGGVNMRMPRELGVKVETEKHFLSGVQLEGFIQRDSVHYSSNYDTAKIRVSVRVETGIGGLKITWI